MFMTAVVEALKELIPSTTKTLTPPPMMEHSIRRAFHSALLENGWEIHNGRYRKLGLCEDRYVPMASAIQAEKQLA